MLIANNNINRKKNRQNAILSHQRLMPRLLLFFLPFFLFSVFLPFAFALIQLIIFLSSFSFPLVVSQSLFLSPIPTHYTHTHLLTYVRAYIHTYKTVIGRHIYSHTDNISTHSGSQSFISQKLFRRMSDNSGNSCPTPALG